jgi:multidrug transporter EmrE-like cation transporter
MSLGVVLVPAVGVMVFGEQVRPVFWVGAGLIVAGIVLTQYGVAPGGG